MSLLAPARPARPGRPSVALFAAIRRDALAGLVAGIIALPLSIALAVAVGAPPAAGLYTAVFAGAAASLFGGSRYNITGPTAALVPLLSHVTIVHGPAALPLVGMMAGVLLLTMSALRFGRLVRYMPGLVVVGFTAGIALSIAFGQINNVLGVSGTDPTLEHFHARLLDTIAHLGTVHIATPLVGLASLAVLVLWPRITERIPAPLAAVVIVTAATWVFDVQTPTIAGRYGALPSGLPLPSLAFLDIGLVMDLIPAAVAIAILAAVESLLSAVVADGMSTSTERHNPDAELRGQGIANLIGPIMGGIPATAAIARTAAAVRAGGASRLTGLFHALTVLAATLALGGLAGHIPLTTLAAVLLSVAWRIAEVPEVTRLLRRAPREDVMVLAGTMLITLFFDLTYAIGAGVVASTVLLLRRLMTALPAAEELLPDEAERQRRVTPELAQLIRSRPDIAFFTAQGLLSFHSAAAFEYELLGASHRPLVLRMKDVHHIDASGLLTLEGIIEHRRHAGGRIVLTAVQPSVRAAMERFGILELLGPGNTFEHTACAVRALDG